MQQLFHLACRRGNVETVKNLLDKVDLEGVDAMNWKPLHYAAKFGNIEIVKILLNEKVDFMPYNKKNLLPIHYAIKNGHYDIFLLLFSTQNLKCEFEDKHILYYSIIFNQKRIFKFILLELLKSQFCKENLQIPYLLEEFLKSEIDNFSLLEKIDYHAFDLVRTNFHKIIYGCFKFHPMEMLFMKCGLDIAKIILSLGKKDIFICDLNDLIAVVKKFVTNDNVELIKLFMKHEIIDMSIFTRKIIGPPELLRLAVNKKSIKIIRFYLDSLKDKKCFNLGNYIGFIRKSSFADLIKLFIEYNLNLNDKSSIGASIVHYVCSKGDSESLKLLDGKVNFDAVDSIGKNILHYACIGGNLEIVQELVSRRYCLNSKDLDTWTPLDHACHRGHQEIISLLLEKGAGLRSSKYSCTLSIAYNYGNINIMKILLSILNEKSVNYNWSIFHTACMKRDIKFIKLLLLYNIKFDFKGKHNYTPLEIAVHYNNLNMVKLVVDGFISDKIYRINTLSNIFSVNLDFSTNEEIVQYISAKRELYMRTMFINKIDCFSDVELTLINKKVELSND